MGKMAVEKLLPPKVKQAMAALSATALFALSLDTCVHLQAMAEAIAKGEEAAKEDEGKKAEAKEKKSKGKEQGPVVLKRPAGKGEVKQKPAGKDAPKGPKAAKEEAKAKKAKKEEAPLPTEDDKDDEDGEGEDEDEGGDEGEEEEEESPEEEDPKEQDQDVEPEDEEEEDEVEGEEEEEDEEEDDDEDEDDEDDGSKPKGLKGLPSKFKGVQNKGQEAKRGPEGKIKMEVTKKGIAVKMPPDQKWNLGSMQARGVMLHCQLLTGGGEHIVTV